MAICYYLQYGRILIGRVLEYKLGMMSGFFRSFFILNLIQLLLAANALAEINPLQYKVWRMETKKYDFNQTPKMEKYIPLTLKPSSSSSTVMNQIADQSLQTWLNSDYVRESSIAGAAASVQDKMKADVSVPSKDGKTEHKFCFEYLLAQTTAQMKYSGWLNAIYKFEGASNTSNVEITEKVFHNKDMYVTHSISSAEAKSAVGLKWNW